MADTVLKIKIKPEMMAAAKGQLSFVKGQAGGAAKGGGALSALQGLPGVGAVGKMMPAITTGVVGIGLIAGGIGLIVKALMGYKPLMNMINMIVKMLSLILRPIADVIIIILMPILYILKPILMVANQLIAPYRRLAFQLLAAGGQAMQAGDVGTATKAFGAAAMTMFAGINTFIIGILSSAAKLVVSGISELIKLPISAILSTIAMIAGIFNSTAKEKILGFKDKVIDGIDEGISNIHKVIDIAGAAIITSNATMIAMMVKTLGVITDEQLAQFVTGMQESIKSVFGNDLVSPAIDKWAELMLKSLDLMDTEVVKKIQEMGESWNEAMTGGVKIGTEEGAEEAGEAQEKEQRGFWGKVIDSIRTWITDTKTKFVAKMVDWGILSGDAITMAISGPMGLIDVTKKEFQGFENRQNEIVSPIKALVARFAREVAAFNRIQVRNISVSDYGGRNRYSRSR